MALGLHSARLRELGIQVNVGRIRVEACFRQLSNDDPRRSAFTSLAGFNDAIELWTGRWNVDPRPFNWTRTANDILGSASRGRAAVTYQSKSATDTGSRTLPMPPSSLASAR